jgi:ubiquinone/menaquinone biosynthesis C-methylase UbiE
LDAELNHVLENIHPGDIVLELGCGYGRLLPAFAGRSGSVIGVDTSFSSLRLAKSLTGAGSNCFLASMNAAQLAFRDSVFDVVVCIQNGISAFHVHQRDLICECIRIAKSGGRVLLSSYSEKFWNDRLEWFRLQSDAGLVGTIDWKKTRDGIIVCKDGFTATTVGPDQFKTLTYGIADISVSINEVDESSLFCEIIPRKSESLNN